MSLLVKYPTKTGFYEFVNMWNSTGYLIMYYHNMSTDTLLQHPINRLLLLAFYPSSSILLLVITITDLL